MAGQNQADSGEPKDASLTGLWIAKRGGLIEASSRTTVHVFSRALWGCQWRGASALPQSGPVLLIANHPSYIDPAAIYAGLSRRVHWMAWRAIFRVPPVAFFVRGSGAFPVSDITTDTRAMRTAVRILKAGRVVGIFPEGGRSLPSGEMLPFLTSPFRFAVRLQCPILPVTVNGSGRIWPRGRWLPRIGGAIEIIHHPPIAAPANTAGGSKAANARAAWLARKTRETILDHYRAPEPVLELSRRAWALDPQDHPMVQANRAGASVVDWVKGGRWPK
jgi:1-acyl-sn-glycerol-3-phosphate acyltransferase